MASVIQKTSVIIGDAEIEIMLLGGFSEEGSQRMTDMHNHHNYEAHYIEEGEFVFELENGALSANEKTLVIIPPKMYHRIVGKSERLKRLSFEFNISKHKNGGETYEKYSRILSKIDSAELLGDNIDGLASITSRRGVIMGEEEHAAMNAYFTLCFINLFEILAERFGVSVAGKGEMVARISLSDNDYIFISALSYIKNNYMRKLSLAEVAREVNLSERQLQRLLKKKLNETFSAFLSRCRINAARAALAESENMSVSLEDIAISVGFLSYVSFFNSFKAIVGVTPREYRASCSNTRKKY